MLKIKFYNLKKIFGYIDKLKTEKVNYPSVFNSVKKMSLFFILYLFITGITTFIIIFSINKDQEMITVPKVINLKFYTAYQILSQKGLNVDVELKNYENIDEGKVAWQSIKEQKKVKKGRTIKLTISLGSTKKSDEPDEGDAILNSYVINFKLPDMYSTARVKVLISDLKETDKVIFDEIISPTNKLKLPIKYYGQGIQKIYINEDLFIEKALE